MEVVDFGEAFEEAHGDLEFSHTKVILQKNFEYFYAITTQRCRCASDIDPSTLDCIAIPSSRILPVFPAGYTRVSESLPSDCYVKRPALLCYGDTPASSEPSTLLLREAQTCEVLRRHPHTNIAKYLGCLVDDNGRIAGLCFVKYGPNLMQLVRSDRQFDRRACLTAIRGAVKHLHKLGLVHGDLTTYNILSNGEDFVIGDFDSCTPEGKEFELKTGTKGWTKGDSKIARCATDWYGVSKIGKFLFPSKVSNNCSV